MLKQWFDWWFKDFKERITQAQTGKTLNSTYILACPT